MGKFSLKESKTIDSIKRRKNFSFLLVLAIGLAIPLLAPTVKQPAKADSIGPAEERPKGSDLLQTVSSGHVIGFGRGEMYVAGSDHVLRISFVGARPVAPSSLIEDEGIDNGQHTRPLERVIFQDLWDGVTLVCEKIEGGVVKSTYYIDAGKGPEVLDKIRLAYNLPVHLDEKGRLLLTFKTGQMSESRPVAWQEISGQSVPVEADFRIIDGRDVGFSVKDYDPKFPLVIDPVLTWNTFMGSTNADYNSEGNNIVVDNKGNVYIGGRSNLTWGIPVNPHSGGGNDDAFAAKLDWSGNRIWHTFMGSNGGNDQGRGIAVDDTGNVYVTGYSDVTWGSPLNDHTGGAVNDVFVAKLDSSGATIWETFMGSGNADTGYGITVDSSGTVYVTGSAGGTWGAPVTSHTGGADAFAAKLDSSGATIWETFMGSGGAEIGYGIAVDSSGTVFVTGQAANTWGAPKNPYAGGSDAFAAKLDSSGVSVWHTFLGSTTVDIGYGIAVDNQGNVYVVGVSDDTWVAPAPVNPHAGGDDAFTAKLDSSGVSVWHTFLGSATDDSGYGIAVDNQGNVYVVGVSDDTWGEPVTAHAGNNDAFAAKLDSSGDRMWETFMGSTFSDIGYGIAIDSSFNVYIAGHGQTTWGSPVNSHAGNFDVFGAKLSGPVSKPKKFYFGQAHNLEE